MGPQRSEARAWIARGYSFVEDAAYVGLGVLLAAMVLALLAGSFIGFARTLSSGSIWGGVIEVLDRILLILLIVELLYTVQVSFREHALLVEPFLLLGLISAIRRLLVVTARMGESGASHESAAALVAELAVLAVLIVALAVSLILLRRSGAAARRI
jgi:uncharacterized membrane protein (DUF373 family)